MRMTVLLVVAVCVAISACARPTARSESEGTPLTTVTCADVQRLTVRATSAAQQWSNGASGDRARIIANNRATYFAALANVAQLKCRTTDTQADGALTMAFDAVTVAERTASEYESAQKWGEAALYATQAAGHLIRQAPAR